MIEREDVNQRFIESEKAGGTRFAAVKPRVRQRRSGMHIEGKKQAHEHAPAFGLPLSCQVGKTVLAFI